MNQESFARISKNNRSYNDFPCLAEKKIVDQCYERTRYSRSECASAIDNYKNCKKFWGDVDKARRKAGVGPAKPDTEERAKIKAYFKEHHRLPEFTSTT